MHRRTVSIGVRAHLRLVPNTSPPPASVWTEEPLAVRRGDFREYMGLADETKIIRYVLTTPGATILRPGQTRRFIAFTAWRHYVGHLDAGNLN